MKTLRYKLLLIFILITLFKVFHASAQDNNSEEAKQLALRIAQAIKINTTDFRKFAAFDVAKHLNNTEIKFTWKDDFFDLKVSDTNSHNDFVIDVNGKYVSILSTFRGRELDRRIYEIILKEKFGPSAELTLGHDFYYNIHFTGIVDSVDMSCGMDAGDCSIIISNHAIIWGKDWDTSHNIPHGKLLNMNNLRMDELQGRKVEVYCGYAMSYSSIIGSDKYYIKLLD
jgi:hypothetical protein